VSDITRRIGMFVSRPQALRDARAFVESFCGEAGLDGHACARLNLVVEELFLNTVKHGHRGGSDAPVWITLAKGSGVVRMGYEDHAPPFNPFATDAAGPPESSAEPQREGGVGVLLARGLTSAPQYAYLFGRNCLELTVAA
jgi:serine/threonine-protein kinase RsbW